MIAMLFTGALAAPFNGCTFYKDRLIQQSWPGGMDSGCANFHVEAQSCIKTKYVGATLVTYQGDLVTGRLPEYFIEVTPHFGTSVFTKDPDGASLVTQMESASAYWKAEMGIVPDMALTGTIETDPDSPGMFLYGRAVKVPYGTPSWGQATIGVNAGAAGPPICFESLSEFTPKVWSDSEGHAESFPAALVNGVASDVCFAPGLALTNDAMDPPAPDLVEPCATPASRSQILAGMAAPGSEFSDIGLAPTTMCMGRLGPLLPRTGWTNADELTGAQTIAYRTASIGKDHFLAGPGVEAGDRWQVVWPPAANPLEAQCFRPGIERPLVELLPIVNLPTVPATDGPGTRPGANKEGSSTYVFAVWRRFTKCVEPGQGALWQAELEVLRLNRQLACATTPDFMP